ncbi:lysophospholipase [Reichenbachiella agarivorans]|uniref:Lysophospholipase n=1 Tax=Reichenbachiella agarivorans TaxID=2979464 RepID=A0ABY6CSN2_9BACT|nr:lysophospholipase [Reichenbachiella agarivorans]UXP33536.1 lysophospholipase [Reichenbachiella agarivorans]
MESYILIGLISYVLLCVVVYFVQDYFMFHPEKLPENFEFSYEEPFKEYFFDIEEGVKINGLRFTVKSPKGIVLYFHGNTRSIKGWSKYAKDFTRNDFEVLIIDYRGFGKSTGKRAEKSIYKDSQYIYNEVREWFPEKQIIVYGRSMGSGFATKLASKNQPKMLILDAPYYSLSQLTSRWFFFLPLSILLKYHIRTDIWIKYVRCPIYIIHGTKDRLIPYRSSVRLRLEAPLTIRLIPIHGGRHNDLPRFAEYHNHLNEILQEQYDVIFDRNLKDFLDF